MGSTNQTKTCTKCHVSKPLISFHADSQGRFGVKARCKPCLQLYNQQRNQRPDVKAKNRQQSLIWSRSNKDKIKQRDVAYRLNNPEKQRQFSANKRARKLSATPPWLTGAQLAHIKRTYKLAHLMEDITGIKYHVDHIVPLKGKDVCGLHVPWNLQVIPAKDNLTKSNKHEVD